MTISKQFDSFEPIEGDLVIVSNRQPYRHSFRPDDDMERTISVDRPTGGLTSGLDPVMRKFDGTWIAWGDGDADDVVTDTGGIIRVPPDTEKYTLKRIYLSPDEVQAYYRGYSNQVLWPLCHGIVSNISMKKKFWRTYREVNERFASITVNSLEEDSVIWFQDYHLALAPDFVRSSLGNDATLAHFWHIPWPEWETFRVSPHRLQILHGLLGNDMVGFHLPRYRDAFLRCVDTAIESATIDWQTHNIHLDGRSLGVRAFPMGIDVRTIQSAVERSNFDAWSVLASRYDIPTDDVLGLGVERLDYTKGILERLAALEHLWESDTHLQTQFTYIQKGTESRSSIPAYKKFQRSVTTEIDRINDRFSTEDWLPIIYIDEHLSPTELHLLYRNADIALVSPIRDGLNLVAQEYVAANHDSTGVLLLSELAGVHDLIGEFTLTINPYDTTDFTDTIRTALSMPTEEQYERMFRMGQIVASNDIESWIFSILNSLPRLSRSEGSPGTRHSTL